MTITFQLCSKRPSEFFWHWLWWTQCLKDSTKEGWRIDQEGIRQPLALNNVSHNNAKEAKPRRRRGSLYVHTRKQQRAVAVRGEFTPRWGGCLCAERKVARAARVGGRKEGRKELKIASRKCNVTSWKANKASQLRNCVCNFPPSVCVGGKLHIRVNLQFLRSN